MTPLAYPNNRYCGLAEGYTTYIYNDALNAQISVARRPGGVTEDLSVRGLPLHGYHAPTDQNGTPSFWEDLGGILKGSPTAVWDANTTQFDVFGIGTDDRVYHIRWTLSTSWGQWGVIATSPGLGYSGTAITETVNVDREPNGQFDLFIRGPSADGEHALLASDGLTLYYWESIGSPVSGAGIKGTPSGRWNSQGSRLDVFAVGNDDHPHLTSWTASGWTPWSGAYTGPSVAAAVASTSGAIASVNEQVMAVRAPDDSLDVFYRGASNDAIHIWTNSNGTLLGWESLGGVIKGAPDGKWNANTTHLDVFVIGNDDRGYQNTFYGPCGGTPPCYWSGWRSLTGGGTWG